MLKRPTVFILGAGAGIEIGMPVGERLSSIIASKLNIRFQDGYTQKSGDRNIMEALRKVAAQPQSDVNAWRAAGCMIAEGVHYTRSIDSYINAHRDNEKVRVCAKLGIAQTIVEHEKASAVYVARQHPRRFKNHDDVLGSWLRAWMYVLQEGIVHGSNTERIFDNLCVINFNYDRCIEQFLFNALQNLYQMQEGPAAEILNAKFKIYHPYGTIGCLPWQRKRENLRVVPFGGSEHGDDLKAMAEGVKTFNEQVEDVDVVRKLGEEISQATQIVFLGFHFHPQNMELLQSINPARGGNVSVYGTAFERSTAELTIINKQIQQMLVKRGGHWNVFLDKNMDCKGLFREYATTLIS